MFRASLLLALTFGLACGSEDRVSPTADVGGSPPFERVQPDLFSADGGQPNAWADYDGDGDLDLFVGFRGRANRLYRNDEGVFTDVAAEVGLADEPETRAAAWGDYDGDGDPDLYVGFRLDPDTPNRLYRNDGGERFVDVGAELGLAVSGNTRQPSFVDYDGDGDLDLFVAFREQANRLYRNEGDTFEDVTDETGVGDVRRTVGAVWFDADGDGDLDLFVANQNGDEDGLYRNDEGRFTDVAPEWAMNQPGRTEERGSVGVSVADYDNDGDLDLFVASYGPEVLWQNQGGGSFVDAVPGSALDEDRHSVAAAWGDYDNDGSVDLFVGAYLSGTAEVPDRLYRNVGDGFEVATPQAIIEKGASHGVSWADYDRDGDLDLALANNDPDGAHPLYRNDAPVVPGRSLQVVVTDANGLRTRAGATVTLSASGGESGFVATRLVDTGGGYSSQSEAPVHFGIPAGVGLVDVEVTVFLHGEVRRNAVRGIDPTEFHGRWLEVRAGR